jgi:hypothetical protein
LNESLEEATCTNIPTSWRPLVAESPSAIQDLFSLLQADMKNEKSLQIKMLAS